MRAVINRISLFSSFRYHYSDSDCQWKNKYDGVFIKLHNQRFQPSLKFFANKEMTFKHLVMGLELDETAFRYPEGVNQQTNVVQFLNNWKTPGVVDIKIDGYRKRLYNKASQRDSVTALKVVKDPNSIYGRLFKFLSNNPDDKSQSSDINYFLKHYYMRLTAQTYCMINNINPMNKMTPQLIRGILQFIGQQYENTSPAEIKNLQKGIEAVKIKILQTNQQLANLLEQGDKIINVYRYAAIIITAIHITLFFVMIFRVDWLGWDITEPLTYTVGVIYTLLGIRFYRKYRTDRNSQNIQQVLKKAILNPRKIIKQHELKHRQQLHFRQLRRLECKSRILKNRINFRTSLCDALTLQRYKQ